MLSEKKKGVNIKVILVVIVFCVLLVLLGFQLLRLHGYCGDNICQETEVCKSAELVCLKQNGSLICYNPGDCDKDYCEIDCA